MNKSKQTSEVKDSKGKTETVNKPKENKQDLNKTSTTDKNSNLDTSKAESKLSLNTKNKENIAKNQSKGVMDTTKKPTVNVKETPKKETLNKENSIVSDTKNIKEDLSKTVSKSVISKTITEKDKDKDKDKDKENKDKTKEKEPLSKENSKKVLSKQSTIKESMKDSIKDSKVSSSNNVTSNNDIKKSESKVTISKVNVKDDNKDTKEKSDITETKEKLKKIESKSNISVSKNEKTNEKSKDQIKDKSIAESTKNKENKDIKLLKAPTKEIKDIEEKTNDTTNQTKQILNEIKVQDEKNLGDSFLNKVEDLDDTKNKNFNLSPNELSNIDLVSNSNNNFNPSYQILKPKKFTDLVIEKVPFFDFNLLSCMNGIKESQNILHENNDDEFAVFHYTFWKHKQFYLSKKTINEFDDMFGDYKPLYLKNDDFFKTKNVFLDNKEFNQKSKIEYNYLDTDIKGLKTSTIGTTKNSMNDNLKKSFEFKQSPTRLFTVSSPNELKNIFQRDASNNSNLYKLQLDIFSPNSKNVEDYYEKEECKDMYNGKMIDIFNKNKFKRSKEKLKASFDNNLFDDIQLCSSNIQIQNDLTKFRQEKQKISEPYILDMGNKQRENYLKSLKNYELGHEHNSRILNPVNNIKNKHQLINSDIAFDLDYKDILERQKIKINDNQNFIRSHSNGNKLDKKENKSHSKNKVPFKQKAIILEKKIQLGKNQIISTLDFHSKSNNNYTKEKNEFIYLNKEKDKKISNKGAELLKKLSEKNNI